MKTILFSLFFVVIAATSVSAQQFNAKVTLQKSWIEIHDLPANKLSLISFLVDNVLPDSTIKTDSTITLKFKKQEIKVVMDKFSYAMYLNHVIKVREDAIAKEKKDEIPRRKAIQQALWHPAMMQVPDPRSPAEIKKSQENEMLRVKQIFDSHNRSN